MQGGTTRVAGKDSSPLNERLLAPMLRKEEEPECSPRKRAACCHKHQRAGGVVAVVAAAIAIAVVTILGEKEMHLITNGASHQQAKLTADYDLLVDNLRDLSDMLPQLESNMERMVDGLAGTFDMKFGNLLGSLEERLSKMQEEQKSLIEAAKAAANPPPPPAPTRRVVQLYTKPSFTVVTEEEEKDVRRSIADVDLHWRLLRRYFLERRTAEEAEAGAAPRPGGQLVVDAGCGWDGSYSLFAAAHGHRALCFEPDPAALPLLEAGLRENKDTGHLVWAQARGLGAKRSNMKFPDGKAGGVEVQVHPLDECLFEPAELLRVGVAGQEVPVLQGAKAAVEQLGVNALLVDLSPAQWARAGISLEDGVSTLAWLQRAGGYRVHLLVRPGAKEGACPGHAIAALGATLAPAAGAEGAGGGGGEELLVRRADDKGEEGAGGAALQLAEPFESSAYSLLRAMRERGWSCSLWLERRPAPAPAGAAEAATAAAAAGAGAGAAPEGGAAATAAGAAAAAAGAVQGTEQPAAGTGEAAEQAQPGGGSAGEAAVAAQAAGAAVATQEAAPQEAVGAAAAAQQAGGGAPVAAEGAAAAAA